MTSHPHESDRLESLRSYGILDEGPEPALDAIARLAAQICGTQAAMVGFLDEETLRTKAVYGTEHVELPRSLAPCTGVVAHAAPMVVGDLRRDPRFADNALVTGPEGIRAYAGFPLIGRDGLPLGALCVTDTRPRRFSATQLESLEILAKQVITELELRRLDRGAGRTAHEMLTEASDPARLRRALDAGELIPHFQPVIDMTSGATVGFEALVRWQHPQLGLLSPAVFLPAIESSRLILPVGRHILEESLRLLETLAADPTVPRGLSMAVNVSGVQLQEPGLAEVVIEALDRHQLPAARFTIEVTETMPILDTAIARRELASLRGAGIRLALDDYGVGWSSLGRLLDLPFSVLKLDRSLVKLVPIDARSATIARSTFALARDMEIEVVCEGVERESEQEMLLSMGARLAQGWLFGRPDSAEQVTTHLRAQRAGQGEASAATREPPGHVIHQLRPTETAVSSLAADVQALLDKLPDAAAVLDPVGTLTTVNAAWNRFGLANGAVGERTGKGANYLDTCDRAAASGDIDGALAAAAVRAVLGGRDVRRSFEYGCDTPSGMRWFQLRVTPLSGLLQGALICHVDITRQRSTTDELSRLISDGAARL